MEPPSFCTLPEVSVHFPKGQWRGCDCLWLFGVRHVAWRVCLCFPGGFPFGPWEAVPSFQQEDSAGRAGVSDLCAERAPRGSQEGKSPAVLFWGLQLFPLCTSRFSIPGKTCLSCSELHDAAAKKSPFSFILVRTNIHRIIHLLLV